MSDLTLHAPDVFELFPFSPYEIQQQLMQHLYTSIEEGKTTVIESPTGTVQILDLATSLIILTQVAGKDPKPSMRFSNLA